MERLIETINKLICFIRISITLVCILFSIGKYKKLALNKETLLRLIVQYLKHSKKLYGNSICMNRSIDESLDLLDSIVESYILTKSNTTLDQLLQVLKTEFIKRN